MKDDELQFDRSCRVLYLKSRKIQIRSKIALHYPTAVRENIWERVLDRSLEFSEKSPMLGHDCEMSVAPYDKNNHPEYAATAGFRRNT